MLDIRLKTIAELVRKDSNVCDVGTDHAYLPCYLVKKGITNHCVACDINEQPLQSAKEHIAKYGFEDKIETILSDGLQNVPSSKAQDIVIAGMGGELISKIILACDFTRDKTKRLILQPMTNVPFLRDCLYQHGFEIIKEIPVIDKNQYYTVMHAEYIGVTIQKDELFLTLGKIPEQKTIDAQKYIKKQYDKTIKVADGLKKSTDNSEQAEHYYKLAQEIKTYIEVE